MKWLLSSAVIVFALVWCEPLAAQTDGESSHRTESAPGHVSDAHGESATHGPSYDLLTVDGMTAVWTIVVFLFLLVVLRAFAWKPIQKALIDREEFIRDSLEQAKKDREESEAKLKAYTEQLTAARAEAKAIVEEGHRDAEVVHGKIQEEAKKEAAAKLERARREIQIATDTAVKELYDLSGKLAVDIASRIIRKELNAAEHERLISESIEELTKAQQN